MESIIGCLEEGVSTIKVPYEEEPHHNNSDNSIGGNQQELIFGRSCPNTVSPEASCEDASNNRDG